MPCHVSLLTNSRIYDGVLICLLWFGQEVKVSSRLYHNYLSTISGYFFLCWVYDTSHTVYRLIRLEYRLKRKLSYTIIHDCCHVNNFPLLRQ